MDARRGLNGTYGQLYHEGKWLTNVNKVKIDVEVQKEEVKVSGDRWVHHKIVGLKGKGSASGIKITSEMIRLNGVVADSRNQSFRTELLYKIDDPEAFGVERVQLKNVMFDNLSLANSEPGKVVEEELPFTFEGYELLDPIVES